MKYPELSTEESSPTARVWLVALLAPIFIVLIPGALMLAGRALDRLLGLPRLAAGWGAAILGTLLVLAGFGLAFWSIAEQHWRGRGTPVPHMASQMLVTSGPYAYTRNPMALGTFVAYLGGAVWAGSIMAAVLVGLLTALLLVFIKRGEEAALEARFGEAYCEYRAATPFLIPRLRRKEDDNRY